MARVTMKAKARGEVVGERVLCDTDGACLVVATCLRRGEGEGEIKVRTRVWVQVLVRTRVRGVR